jgi:lipopolysaccharide/colanic/teichoic acid biosynthesis glycosyltransferase
MSIVGPRPLLLEELPLLGDEDHRRHLAKPGLTGLWQINGRKETSWDERIQLDLRYVHDWSIGLDLGIIFKTIKVVFSGKGSY